MDSSSGMLHCIVIGSHFGSRGRLEILTLGRLTGKNFDSIGYNCDSFGYRGGGCSAGWDAVAVRIMAWMSVGTLAAEVGWEF